MEDRFAVVMLGIAAAVLLVLAWMVGVLGKVRLINSYRAHPEHYPDARGLSRWMGYTLGAGGLSLALCALAWEAGSLGEDAVGIWAGVTGAGVALAAVGGLARYRRKPEHAPSEAKRR